MWIELISILLALWSLYFLLLLFIDKITEKKLIKNYDEQKDLSKQGEKRRFSRGGNRKSVIGEQSFKGLDKSERRQLLSTTNVDGVRKNRKSPRGIFRKLR